MMEPIKENSSNIFYSTNDQPRVKNLFTLQLGFMTFIGQIPHIMDSLFPRILKKFGWCLTRLYSVFIIWQTMHTAILFGKTTLDVLDEGELDEITDALTQVTICSFSCFSTCYWLWNSNSLMKYIDFINQHYWHRSLFGLTFVNSYSSYIRSRRITLYWLSSTLGGVCLWGVAPLIQGLRVLPLKCWYPFDPLQSQVYWIVYIVQMFTQINIGATYGCGSALYVSLIVLMLAQYDVLFCSLKNVKYHAELLSSFDLDIMQKQQDAFLLCTNDEVNQYMFLKEEATSLNNVKKIPKGRCEKRELKYNLHESIVKCVKLHQFICESCKMLENLYHPYCLVKSLQFTAQLCLLVFVGVSGERSFIRVFNLFQYSTLTLIELLMFSYFGELLRQHSARAGEAFLRSPWYSYATLISKDILIFLVNSKRTMKLTAGKFFTMDLDRLRSVLTQAFSFLTLLQKLAAKNK